MAVNVLNGSVFLNNLKQIPLPILSSTQENSSEPTDESLVLPNDLSQIFATGSLFIKDLISN
jgi:hypothetical protein